MESQVAALYEAMGLSGADPLPDSFQILFQVDMIDLDDEVVNVSYTAHRVF